MFNIWKLSALSTSGNFLIRQVNQVCCSQHTTYWKLYICRFNFTAKRPTRNPSDQDGHSSWRPFSLRNNYLSTTEIPNDLRITKNTFENLIRCNIRNIKSNFLKFPLNVYHNLLCYFFFLTEQLSIKLPMFWSSCGYSLPDVRRELVIDSIKNN